MPGALDFARIAALVLLLAALLYVGLVACMYAAQRSLIYRPDPTRVVPASIGLAGVREIVLPTPDGAELIAWHAVAPAGAKSILYFHGNGGNLASRRDRIAAYRRFGFGVLMLSYRGYSGSSGLPSEAANVADAKHAYAWLIEQGVAASDIVVFGESLGTGVAVQIAAALPAAGLILDAPYTSLVDAAAEHYPLLPVRLLLADRYESLRRIGAVRMPLLVIHGGRDDVIPIELGRALFAAANDPKHFVEYPEAGHIYHAQFGSLERVRDFIRGL